MRVCAVRVEHLSLAHFLQSHTSSQHILDWHAKEDLISVLRVVRQIQDNLDTVDASCILCPLVYGCCNLLNRHKVYKDTVLAITGPLTKLINMHPLTDLLDGVLAQLSIDGGVVGQRRVIKLLDRNGVLLLGLTVAENKITPHLHLTLTGVHILLNRVEEGPAVVLG